MAELLNEGELKVELKEGNLVIGFDSKGVDAMVKIESDYFMDKLKEAIPGEIDDKVIDIIKLALKASG